MSGPAHRSFRRRPPVEIDGALATDLLRLRAVAGGELGDPRGLPPRTRRALAVAGDAGAPISDALDGAAAAETDARRAERAVAVASAQARAVAGGLLLAPLVLTPALGRLVGADLVGFYTSAPGVLVGVLALALYGVGAGLVVALVRRVGRVTARPARRRWLSGLVVGVLVWWALHPLLAPIAAAVVVRTRTGGEVVRGVDEAADLTATALAGGVSVPAALRSAAAHLPAMADRLHRLAFDLELGIGAASGTGTRPGSVPSSGTDRTAPARQGSARQGSASGFERFAAVLATAVAMGAPVAVSLRRLASDLRADDLARVLAATERLPAQLTFPTALCLLPATILTIGAPVVATGLGAVGT